MELNSFDKIFDILIDTNESKYIDVFNLIIKNDILKSKDGIFDFIASLPFLIQSRSYNIFFYADITKKLINSFDDEKFRKKLRKMVFETNFHPEPESEMLKYQVYSRAYYIRCLYENEFYSKDEICNNIHKFWETEPSCKLPLVALFIWFMPEIYSIKGSFSSTLIKISKRELYSRQLPSCFASLIGNLEKYGKNQWEKYYKEKNDLKNNKLLRCLENDDIEALISMDINDFNQKLPNKIFGYHWFLQFSPSLIQYAAFFGSFKCVKYLASNGADLTYKDCLGNTLLDYTGSGGNIKILTFINKWDPSFNYIQSLNMAILFHRKSLIQFIMESNEIIFQDYLIKAFQSNNSFFLSYAKKLYSNNDNFKINLNLIAQYGSFLLIDENSYNSSESLIIAVKYGHLRFIQHLLQNTHILNSIDFNGHSTEYPNDLLTPIQIAVEMSHQRIAKFLISNEKVDVNVKFNTLNRSLLHVCVLRNLIGVAKALMKCDRFDMNSPDDEGSTPVHYATRNVNTIGTHLVIDFSVIKENFVKTPETYIFNYHKIINLEMFQLFACEKKTKFNVYDNFGLTPLHYIARNGRADFLFYLFYVGRDDIDFRIQTKNGHKTPLHFAAINDRSPIVHFYIENFKCNDCRKDSDVNGATPLHLGCNSGCAECVRLLSDDPSSLNLKDKWERTPLLVAAGKGRAGCIKMLTMAEGIDINLKDSYGRTALKITNDHLYYLCSQFLEFFKAES